MRNGAYPNVGKGIWGGNGGMCVQGGSAGAGAVGYALAWYNAGASSGAVWGQGYLDKAVLKVGPVFSDIQRGCEISCQGNQCTNGQSTAICSNGSTEPGCNNWIEEDGTLYSLEYVDGAQTSVQTWSGNPTPQACANNIQQTTYNMQWLQMSIVDFTETQQPSFNYPNTAVSGWLWATGATGVALNNSSPEAQLFYVQFQNQSQTAGLSVNGVYGCVKIEDVESGQVTVGGVQESGMTAIENDMTDPNAGCRVRH